MAPAAEFVRFAFVGALNNLGGYLLYLAVTTLGADPKLTVSILYPVGVLINYLTHARVSFRARGLGTGTAARFVCAHTVGLLLNLALLTLFVDQLGLPHQAVQLVAVGVVGVVLYALFKLFVFVEQTASRE
ncbi:MAG TPA: GtrA family protein [Microvirga sp.]